jgi:hypothetical protein
MVEQDGRVQLQGAFQPGGQDMQGRVLKAGFTGLALLGMAALLSAAPADALGLAVSRSIAPPATIELAQYRPTRDFRRCMRAKYGPRYFARVPRAHRFHMAQACGG